MLEEKGLKEFCTELASSAPVPGGGGASALGGALAAALASMVAELTAKSQKCEAVHGDMRRLIGEAGTLRGKLLALIGEDARAFAPLAAAYKLPRDTDEEKAARRAVLESALLDAVKPPLAIMQCAREVLVLLNEAKEKGTRMALSDVGVGALFAAAALRGAALNVFINTALMEDRQKAAGIESECNAYREDMEKAWALYEEVEALVWRK
ncbi:MAG: cyclodeaminase/cyclohydrolase family protein [Bacillota bacterium]|nr:cyclodeaminase/cyclohydrolase family protein [Bacillota bacterium]